MSGSPGAPGAGPLCDNAAMNSERPAPDAPGHAGAIAHHATDNHATDDHGADHGHEEDERLGPMDVRAWGAGALGIGLGLIVAVCFMLATGNIPS